MSTIVHLLARRRIHISIAAVCVIGAYSRSVVVGTNAPGEARPASATIVSVPAHGWHDKHLNDLGDMRAGEVRRWPLRFRNGMSSAITIVAAKTSCDCVAISRLPVTLDPSEEGTIEFTIDMRYDPSYHGALAPYVELVSNTGVWCTSNYVVTIKEK